MESSQDAVPSAERRENQIVVAGRVIHAMSVTRHIAVPRLETTTEIAFASMSMPLNALLRGDCRCDWGLREEVFLNGCRQLLSCIGLNNLFFLFFFF